MVAKLDECNPETANAFQIMRRNSKWTPDYTLKRSTPRSQLFEIGASWHLFHEGTNRSITGRLGLAGHHIHTVHKPLAGDRRNRDGDRKVTLILSTSKCFRTDRGRKFLYFSEVVHESMIAQQHENTRAKSLRIINHLPIDFHATLCDTGFRKEDKQKSTGSWGNLFECNPETAYRFHKLIGAVTCGSLLGIGYPTLEQVTNWQHVSIRYQLDIVTKANWQRLVAVLDCYVRSLPSCQLDCNLGSLSYFVVLDRYNPQSWIADLDR